MKRNMIELNLQMFAQVVNATTSASTGNDLSPEMKTFYRKALIELAGPVLVHDQFGQKQPIPQGSGKTVEFRKYTPLEKATTALTEGVTPDGNKLDVKALVATVEQYGDYILITDVLKLTAIDNNVVQATELIAEQAARTLDTVTREIVNGGTNVQYAAGEVTSRSSITKTHKISVDAIYRAVRFLKTQNAMKFEDGCYVGVVHPDVSYDLQRQEEFIDIQKYKNPERLYNGEIGKIAGVRFVETTEAKVFAAAGASGIDVYSTMIFGKNAYGVTSVEGGGLEHIVKALGSGGTADPLNQRATVGWKALKTAVRLVEQYMIRLETASTFDIGAN